jgi:hypothetical protein
MKEGLLMPVKDCFVTNFNRALLTMQFNEPDRWCRSGFEFLGSLVANVRAVLEFHLFGGQLHRERQAGGEITVLAVGLWKEFVDL